MPATWETSPLVLAGAAAALACFGHGFVRLRRRGRHDHAGWGRAALFTAGLALATLPLLSPLDAAGDEGLLTAHMLEHVLIGDAAPPLLLLALRGPLLVFALPVPLARPAARIVPRLTARPWLALSVWAAAMAAWHVPAAYDYAVLHPWAHVCEHLSFVTAGLLVWMQLVDPAGRGRLSLGGRLAFAGAVFGFGQVLGDVLLLSHPLYPFYAQRSSRRFGLSALTDQQLAGVAMMAEQLVTLGTCAALLVGSSLRRGPARYAFFAARSAA